jgi:hypothetical protein
MGEEGEAGAGEAGGVGGRGFAVPVVVCVGDGAGRVEDACEVFMVLGCGVEYEDGDVRTEEALWALGVDCYV